MFRRVSVLIVCLTGLFGAHCKKLPLPNYVKACHRSDPNFEQCIIEHAKDALPTLVKGDRKYAIPNLAPLVLPSVKLDVGDQLELTLNDVHLEGLEKADIKKIKLDLENRKIQLQFHFDNIKIISKYDINGRILILPIQGKGDLNVTALGMTVDYGFSFTVDTKNGEKYLTPVEPYADFKVDRVHFYLGNLFNGNDELGESTNKVLNQEWDKFVGEIKPSINKLIVEIANGVINGITSEVPYSEFFPE